MIFAKKSSLGVEGTETADESILIGFKSWLMVRLPGLFGKAAYSYLMNSIV